MLPRRLAAPVFLAAKLAMVDEPHVAPLNALVRRIRLQHAGVPFFDPEAGGVNARILFLLEAPGPKAVDFVSLDNNDQTAENMLRLLVESGINRATRATGMSYRFISGMPIERSCVQPNKLT